MNKLKCRLVEFSHFKYHETFSWKTADNSCHHSQDLPITEEEWNTNGATKWGDVTRCDKCGISYNRENLEYSGTGESFWKRPDGTTGMLEPGDMYFNFERGGKKHDCGIWGNCDGRHLMAILPNGDLWGIDGRANNCTRTDDNTHRCWIRTGTPPDITVGKDGDTCHAGAGSIQSGDYHGFLRNGEFTKM